MFALNAYSRNAFKAPQYCVLYIAALDFQFVFINHRFIAVCSILSAISSRPCPPVIFHVKTGEAPPQTGSPSPAFVVLFCLFGLFGVIAVAGAVGAIPTAAAALPTAVFRDPGNGQHKKYDQPCQHQNALNVHLPYPLFWSARPQPRREPSARHSG